MVFLYDLLQQESTSTSQEAYILDNKQAILDQDPPSFPRLHEVLLKWAMFTDMSPWHVSQHLPM